MNEKDLPILPEECLDPEEGLTVTAAGPVSPLTGKAEVDLSRLPELPPPESPAWGRSRKGLWKAVGCGCSTLIVILAGIAIYYSLRETVWSSYEDLQYGLRSQLLDTVTTPQREVFLRNLEAFDHMLKAQSDPYTLMGAFVRQSRLALDDLTVNPEEVEQLDTFMETALKNPYELPP